MGALMEWIKWYRETGVRQQENDLRAVALQNQRAELDFNMERLRQQGVAQEQAKVAQEQANQPLYTIPGEETVGPYPGATGEGPHQTQTVTGPPTQGPTPNQIEAVQKAGQYMTPEGLKRMGMAPKPITDKFRNVSPGDVVIDDAGKVIYPKTPAAPKQQAIEWKQGSDGFWYGLPSTVDLPSLMSSGDIPPNAIITDAGNGQAEVKVPPPQQNTQIRETNVSPVPMEGGRQAPTGPAGRFAVRSPSATMQSSEPSTGSRLAERFPSATMQSSDKGPTIAPVKPTVQYQGGVPIIKSNVKGKVTAETPHNDLESYTGTLYPGKTWTELTPKEQEKVYAVMGKEAGAKRGPSEANAQREHLGNAYKSAYYLEINKLMAIYKLIPPAGMDVTQPGILAQMVAEGKEKGKISKERWPEFAKAANDIYARNMVPWYKLYGLEAPKMEFPTNEETGQKGIDTTSDYVRDPTSGKIIKNPNKKG